MSVTDWTITFDLFGLTDKEADDALSRLSDAVCGVDHGPDGECPMKWVGSMKPLEQDEEEE